MIALDDLLARWPVERAASGVTDADETLGLGGDPGWVTRLASISKVLVGLAALVAIEEGSIGLDEPAGPEGSTVRHLLAHASGLGFDDDRQLAAVGRRRIYSNTGIERFAEHLEARSGIAFGDYLAEAVLTPLGMERTQLRGSPAHAVYSCVHDLLRLGRELLRPTLVAPETLAEATSVQFPDLAGVVPELGRFDPNPWGLAMEIRGDKDPHWTAPSASPRTFGHFGGSGTFLWVDPDRGLACVALTDRGFGEWSLDAWPAFSEAVLARF